MNAPYERDIRPWSGPTGMRALIDKKNPHYQYKDSGTDYSIWFDEGFTRYYCVIPYTDTEHKSDFDENYAAGANWAVPQRHYPFASGDFDAAFDAIPESETVIDSWTDNVGQVKFKIPDTGLYLNGGELIVFSGYCPLDWASMKLVDVDGVYYPAGTPLKTWVPKRFIKPLGTSYGLCLCTTPYAGNPLKDVYVVLYYHRTDSNNRTVALNLDLHKAI